MDEPKLLKEILAEAMDAKNYTPEKIAETTGVPIRYIHLLLSDTSEGLPPAPYTRGYLGKIASAIDIDAHTLYRTYAREVKPKRSGETDTLPKNRFAIQHIKRSTIIAGVMTIFLLIYVLTNISKVIRSPDITLTNPRNEITTTNTPTIIIEGTINDRNDIVTLGNEQLFVNEYNEFKKEIALEVGTNTITVTAAHFLGRKSEKTIQIIYMVPTATTTEEKKSH